MQAIVHFELPFNDKARAQTFYNQAFGWEYNEMPDFDYIGITTTPTDEKGMPTAPGGINGGMVARNAETAPAPILTIGVDSLDGAIEKLQTAGGTFIMRGEVPEMGLFGYFKDTEGNVVGLWQDLAG